MERNGFGFGQASESASGNFQVIHSWSFVVKALNIKVETSKHFLHCS